ncbi:hypothetical protein J6590_006485 [Homalodisca vitripennis]|nr:hypothetical protein J6590_006485 [Homalodisca vitripennis]
MEVPLCARRASQECAVCSCTVYAVRCTPYATQGACLPEVRVLPSLLYMVMCGDYISTIVDDGGTPIAGDLNTSCAEAPSKAWSPDNETQTLIATLISTSCGRSVVNAGGSARGGGWRGLPWSLDASTAADKGLDKSGGINANLGSATLCPERLPRVIASRAAGETTGLCAVMSNTRLDCRCGGFECRLSYLH